MADGKKSHSGLHRLKAKKNALGEGISTIRKAVIAQAAMSRLRQQYRAMHLADCYMRGRPYSAVEATRHSQPLWDLVAHYVDQHGGPIVEMPPIDIWSATNSAPAINA